MAEVVKKDQIHYICDKCGEGSMITYARDISLYSNKEIFPSQCDNPKCRYKHDMLKRYPKKFLNVKINGLDI